MIIYLNCEAARICGDGFAEKKMGVSAEEAFEIWRMLKAAYNSRTQKLFPPQFPEYLGLTVFLWGLSANRMLPEDVRMEMLENLQGGLSCILSLI